MKGGLFTTKELRQPVLTQVDKANVLSRLKKRADWGIQWLYEVSETAAILHLTADEMQGLIYSYKLDCTRIRTTLRVPWWSICEYIIDPAEDIEQELEDYLKSLPQKVLA